MCALTLFALTPSIPAVGPALFGPVLRAPHSGSCSVGPVPFTAGMSSRICVCKGGRQVLPHRPFCPHPQRPACRPTSQHTEVWISPYHPWGHRGNWEAGQGEVSQCCYMVLHNLPPRGASLKAPTQPFSSRPSLSLPLKHEPLWTLLPLALSCPVLPYSTSAS